MQLLKNANAENRWHFFLVPSNSFIQSTIFFCWILDLHFLINLVLFSSYSFCILSFCLNVRTIQIQSPCKPIYTIWGYKHKKKTLIIQSWNFSSDQHNWIGGGVITSIWKSKIYRECNENQPNCWIREFMILVGWTWKKSASPIRHTHIVNFLHYNAMRSMIRRPFH